jgi:prolyl-tRNA editing enzyme YbaK/EbsC (Cys-tRNA(Pro) deacylase)
VARCSGTTKKGSQCRLNAIQGHDYCALHITQDPSAPTGREAIEQLEARLSESVKTLLGVAIAAGIVLSVLIKRR